MENIQGPYRSMISKNPEPASKIISRERAEAISEEASRLKKLIKQERKKELDEKLEKYLAKISEKLLPKASKLIEKSARKGETGVEIRPKVDNRKKVAALGYLLTELGFGCEYGFKDRFVNRRFLLVRWEGDAGTYYGSGSFKARLREAFEH